MLILLRFRGFSAWNVYFASRKKMATIIELSGNTAGIGVSPDTLKCGSRSPAMFTRAAQVYNRKYNGVHIASVLVKPNFS